LQCRQRKLFDSETDGDHSADVVVIDTLVNDDDDDDDDKAEAASAGYFDWEGISNYKGEREQYRGGFGPQVAAKKVQRIVESFQLFFNREFVQKPQKRPTAMLYNFKIPTDVCSHKGQ
jgi:hypothetical protein